MSTLTSNLWGGMIVVHHHGHRHTNAFIENCRTLQSRWGAPTQCCFFLPLQLSISPREGEARCRYGKSVIARAQKCEEYESEPEVFSEMNEWIRNKPPGFGENRTYDTSLEEKLLAEIEQSKKALNNKKQPKVSESKSESVPSGVNVLIGNLPKKKNISRDLQASFKGYPGLLHISPVESGNKKTRDPICKGAAFFVFKNEDVANRFISRYNGESIVFGKIQKQITCSLPSTNGLTESGLKALSTKSMHTIPKLRIRDKGIDFTDYVTESGVFQDQPKDSHARFSVNLGSEYEHCQGNVNDNKELSERTGAENSVKISLSKHCLLYDDTDEGHSEYTSKLSHNSMNANAKRASEKVIKSMPDNSKLENADESQSSEGQQKYQYQASNIVQDSESQTSVSKLENICAMKQNVSSTVLTCATKIQRRKQKMQMKRKNQTAIETRPSNNMRIIGSAQRLKKKERSVLFDVLVKYGQHTASTT